MLNISPLQQMITLMNRLMMDPKHLLTTTIELGKGTVYCGCCRAWWDHV